MKILDLPGGKSAKMDNEQIKKDLSRYLNEGRENIDNNDPEFKNVLRALKKHLQGQQNQNDNHPELNTLSSVITVLLKNKNHLEKQLKDVASSYDEVLGLITHEFKNILTSIHGYNMLLEKHMDREKDDQSFRNLMDSDRLTRQLFDMTDSLLKMSLGEKGLLKPELKLIDFIEDILEPVKRDLDYQLRAKKMKILLKQKTKKLIFECDIGLMDIVIRNLLINAIKYGKHNTSITIDINRSKHDFLIAIKNLSDDIPANLCTDIFEKFRSRKIGSEKGGTGIGLYNVQNIIKLHHGTITCKCLAGKWIEFKFNIPQNILEGNG